MTHPNPSGPLGGPLGGLLRRLRPRAVEVVGDVVDFGVREGLPRLAAWARNRGLSSRQEASRMPPGRPDGSPGQRRGPDENEHPTSG